MVWSGLVWSGSGKVLLDWEVRGNLKVSAYDQPADQMNNHPKIEPSRFLFLDWEVSGNMELGNVLFDSFYLADLLALPGAALQTPS